MKQLKRIVTWMGYPPTGNPQAILAEGSHIYELGEKVRLFAVRKVSYDDTLTPMYASPIPIEFPVTDVKLLDRPEVERGVINAPILDIDNKLKAYKP